MRRPSPIPRSAEPVEQEVVRLSAAAEAEDEGSAFPGDGSAPAGSEEAGETIPLAPLPGMRRAGRSQGDPSPSRVAPSEAAATSENAGRDRGEQSIGARDVWRAARARRRILRAEIRRFTQRSRRRRAVWIAGAAAAVLIVCGSAAAAYSPLFGVEKITVVGTTSLDPAVVEQALSGQLGTPLALVDSSAVKAALVGFPLIETYHLEARPPHDLTVRIVERTPVGVIPTEAGYTVVDAAGVALSTTPDRPAGFALLEVRGGLGSSAFASAGRVMRALPSEMRGQVDKATATSADDVTLTLGTGTTVLWGSAERSADKAFVLGKAMAALPGKSVYDVSTPDAITVG